MHSERTLNMSTAQSIIIGVHSVGAQCMHMEYWRCMEQNWRCALSIGCERVHGECWHDTEKSCNLCGILVHDTKVVHTR
jgi:hypothetical protein